MDIKMIGIAILVTCILLLVFVEVKKRSTFKALHQYLSNEQYGEYLTLLNSFFVKLTYQKYNRLYMKLNACFFMEDQEEIAMTIKEMLQLKMSTKQREEILNKAFHFYVEQEDKSQAELTLQEIDQSDNEALKQECHQTYDIFMLGKFHYIEAMEEHLKQVSGIDRGLLEYLLSVQYENKGDMKKSQRYLEQSQMHMEAMEGLH